MSASARKAVLVWTALIVIALLAGAWGVLSLMRPHAGWLPGLAHRGDVPPVWDAGLLIVPVVLIGVGLQRLGLALQLDWLAWRTRRARRRREP